jgi:co-chaperonin GroES (HSP10)
MGRFLRSNLILKKLENAERTLPGGLRLPDNCLKEALDDASVVAIVGAEHYRLPNCPSPINVEAVREGIRHTHARRQAN